MSADALRKVVIEQIDKLNVEAMNNACGVRPNFQTSADGLALTVVDQLAMARAFAICAGIVSEEFRKMTAPPEVEQKEKPKIREVY